MGNADGKVAQLHGAGATFPSEVYSRWVNSGQLIFKYVFPKIFHYSHRCDQQNYTSLEVVTRPFSKKYEMANKN